MRRTAALLGMLVAAGMPTLGAQTDVLAEIRAQRLRGALAPALELAQEQLASAVSEPGREVLLRLEIARILDRFRAAPQYASGDRRPGTDRSRRDGCAGGGPMGIRGGGAVACGVLLPGRDGRREDSRSRLPTSNAPGALQADLGDAHGEADAVHLLGLIRMQRGELEAARALFERSLELDATGGHRTFFRGEYERHVGFVLLEQGNRPAAVPYFERSLEFRREAGAIDASLFAANSLAGTLIVLGRAGRSKRSSAIRHYSRRLTRLPGRTGAHEPDLGPPACGRGRQGGRPPRVPGSDRNRRVDRIDDCQSGADCADRSRLAPRSLANPGAEQQQGRKAHLHRARGQPDGVAVRGKDALHQVVRRYGQHEIRDDARPGKGGPSLHRIQGLGKYQGTGLELIVTSERRVTLLQNEGDLHQNAVLRDLPIVDDHFPVPRSRHLSRWQASRRPGQCPSARHRRSSRWTEALISVTRATDMRTS